MAKGSSPSGTTTVVQNQQNPTQTAQLPYLTGAAGLNSGNPNPNQGWNQAVNLSQGDPYQYYPGQTLANFDPNIAGGYNALIHAGYSNANTADIANNNFLYGNMGGYKVQNSPAFNTLNALTGNNYYTPNFQMGALNNLTTSAQYANAGTNNLTAAANGVYLNANPYIAAEYKAAAQPVVNAYQTATAPQTDSNFEAAGRYGSGALDNARSQNELNLGTTLGNLSANLYGQDYANERGLQTQAAGTLGSLTNQQNQLAQNAAATGGQLQLGTIASELGAANALQSGYQAGNTATNQSLLMEPNVLAGNLEPSQAITAGGQGLTGLSQAQISDAMNRFYGNIQAPWTTNEQYLNQIGQPTSGSANSQTTSPYFQNGLANVLGAGIGGLGLFNGLNSATGGSLGSGLSSALGGIFGSGGFGASDIAALQAAGGIPALSAAGGLLGFDFGGGGALAAAPALIP